jgi:signal transduction histidine kinase
VPIPESDDEIALLARTLDAMLGRLHAAADRQRTFLADAAHELRSPIAAITTTLEVALRHPREADWAATARDALAEGERMARLVDDLLLLARADAGPRGTPRAMRPVPLAPVVEAGCSDGAAGARDHVQVQLITSGTGSAGSASEELLVLGEPDALRRVVRNLVENGCRYAASTVTVGVRRDGGSAVVEVSDDGPGIPAEQHERVFERFTRLDLARDRDSGGAGLGLAIARAIAREHGGDVALVDAPHGGVRAVLTLPLADGGAGT